MLVLFGSMLALVLLNVPLVFALGISCVIWMVTQADMPIAFIINLMFRSLDSFPLLAMPFFMFAGAFMSTGGITIRLVNLADVLVGSFRGGLSQATVLASMFFGGLTGSAAAEAAAIGSLSIPAMVKEGYDRDLAVVVTAVASVIGVIIPPSMITVFYAVTVDISIGKLLVAGIFPGIVMGLCLMGINYIFAVKRNYPAHPRVSFWPALQVFKRSFLALGVVLVIVGGIYAGYFTATEAAVAATLYAFLLGVFIYRELKWKDFFRIFWETGLLGGVGVYVITTAMVFAWIINREELPQLLVGYIMAVTQNKHLILTGIIILMVFIGTFAPGISAIVLCGPILYKIGEALGFDPFHFGIVVVLSASIGLVSPPVAPCLYISCAIGKIEVSRIFKTLSWYYLALVASAFIVGFVPFFSTWIPKMMWKG